MSRYPAKQVAFQLADLAFAPLVMAFVLALIHPGLSPDRDRKLAFGFYSLLAALPTAAIVYGSVRRRPVVSVVAWKVLLLETAAIMRG